ncbi:MAG: NADPH-dependent glutamate synthase [Armatimonadota bacterium]
MDAKQKMSITRQPMREQDAQQRSGNFQEVNQGYELETAILEAHRCLNCKNAKCIEGCPVGVNIPKFITLLAERDLAGAATSLLTDNALPSITGRVCPQETQCEVRCVRGVKSLPVAIGYLERFVADWARENLPVAKPEITPEAKSVAVVGAGPGGLTAAGELARLGFKVTVFEAFHKAGGVLSYGIPEFRLPKAIVRSEVQRLEKMGVVLEPNVIVGNTITIPELLQQFGAVFIAVGAGLPIFMNVPGENFKGVYGANEYLTRVNLMKAYDFPNSNTPILKGKRVCVIGGGNVAMDAVRTARRLGAEEAIIVYRRSKEDMPARVEEVHHAEQEGVQLEIFTAPVEVLGNEKRWVTGLKCIRMAAGEPDASGRSRPVPIEGSEFVIPCDSVVVAIGSKANPLLTSTCPDLALDRRGNIITDEKGMTSIPGVFAGGDIVRGAATVILAMGDGKDIAHNIKSFLESQEA